MPKIFRARWWIVAAVLGVLAVGDRLMSANDTAPDVSNPYPVAGLDVDASQLGVPVAQLPPEPKGLFGSAAGKPRDFKLHFTYPTGSDPHTGTKIGPLPILVYFPGWPGDRRDNPGLLEHLAGHGYFVVSVTYVQEDRRLEGGMDFSTDKAAEKTLWMARTKLALQSRDASSVLDALERLNAHDPDAGLFKEGRFKGMLDPGRTAIFGFSFGGAVAAETCAHDTRFRAALNMDGWLFGDGANLSFAQPYFLMSDDDPDPTAAQLASSDPATRYQAGLSHRDIHRMQERLGQPGAILMTILGTQHESFSDSSVHPVPTARVSSIIRLYAIAFFDKVMKSQSPPLLASNQSPYQEVRLSIAR